MFSNMKIAHRLGLGFGLALCFAVALAVAGIGSLASVTGQFKVVSGEILPKTDLANQNIQAAYDYARAFAYIISSEGRPDADAASIERARGILLSTVKVVNDNMVTLTKLLISDTEKALLAKVVERRAAYGKSRNQVLELSKAGEPDKAAKTMFNETNGLQTLYIDSIKELIGFEDGLMKSGVATAEDTFVNARLTLILMVVAMTIVGTMTSVAITRSLLKSLGGEPADAVMIARRIAAGDLTVAVVTQPADTSSLIHGLKTMRDSLALLVTQVRGGTDQIATASSEIATGSLDLSSRTEQQASALQQTAASMEQLAGTVKQNASNAKQANDLAINASAVASKGGNAVSQVIHTMTAINDSSKKIADITNVIDGIAFQTNILALNAAVEAARAGEQGRGFAVVAGEVRILAQRSAAAAKDIKGLIAASVERADHGTILVEQAGVTMTEIVTAIARVGEVVGQISHASADQSAGVAQIGQAVNQMDQATQQNAALVEESSAAAACLSQQAQQLVHAVAAFKT